MTAGCGDAAALQELGMSQPTGLVAEGMRLEFRPQFTRFSSGGAAPSPGGGPQVQMGKTAAVTTEILGI